MQKSKEPKELVMSTRTAGCCWICFILMFLTIFSDTQYKDIIVSIFISAVLIIYALSPREENK
jgi:hypothetical protein